MPITLSRYQAMLPHLEPIQASGVVLRVIGLGVVASGPAVPVGEVCRLPGGADGDRLAVVVGFREGEVILQPIGHVDGIRPGDRVPIDGEVIDGRSSVDESIQHGGGLGIPKRQHVVHWLRLP